jgi:16S rRNA (guanine966-N2)-methyltransferase
LRIIAGSARGKRLVAPKGMTTRPTPDRVKESLFSILGHRVDSATVLDLFAGTGALGLEALSRGAKFATFVESDRAALTALGKNLEVVSAAAHEVVSLPAARALRVLGLKQRAYDLVFLDPPFDSELLAWSLVELSTAGLLLSRALLVCEHRAHAPAPTAPPGFETIDARTFGDVAVTLLTYEKGSRP